MTSNIQLSVDDDTIAVDTEKLVESLLESFRDPSDRLMPWKQGLRPDFNKGLEVDISTFIWSPKSKENGSIWETRRVTITILWGDIIREYRTNLRKRHRLFDQRTTFEPNYLKFDKNYLNWDFMSW